jgi:hypothetical protein
MSDQPMNMPDQPNTSDRPNMPDQPKTSDSPDRPDQPKTSDRPNTSDGANAKKSKTSTIVSVVLILITLGFAAYLVLITAQNTYAMPPVEKLKLPAGFKVTVYSDAVPFARSM